MDIDFERLLPNRPEDTDIRPVEFGEARYPGLIVDGFYRDPDHVRAFAQALRYKAPASCHPGRVALASLSPAPLVSFVYERLGHHYFASPEVMQQEAGACQLFRLEAGEGASARPLPQRPHADHGLLAGLVYLNKPEHCRGGTSFFRHTGTGAEELFPRELMAGQCPDGRPSSWQPDPEVKERMWRQGAQRRYQQAKDAGKVSSYDAYWKLLTNAPGAQSGPILASCGEWELTEVIEMKYNRLLLFPGFLLHSAHFDLSWFDHEPQAWRLTQNWMFNWPGIAR
jgi:hypothetical protein